MAARNRPRAALVKEDPTDAHEERNMWNQIVTDIKKLKQINAKAAELSAQIVDMEAKMGPCRSYWLFSCPIGMFKGKRRVFSVIILGNPITCFLLSVDSTGLIAGGLR